MKRALFPPKDIPAGAFGDDTVGVHQKGFVKALSFGLGPGEHIQKFVGRFVGRQRVASGHGEGAAGFEGNRWPSARWYRWGRVDRHDQPGSIGSTRGIPSRAHSPTEVQAHGGLRSFQQRGDSPDAGPNLGIVPENSNPEEASAAGEAIPMFAPAEQATRIPRNAFEETISVKKGTV